MYARFTEATIDPKQRQRAEEIAKSIFISAKQQKGSKGLSFAIDPKGEAVFVSLWDSRDAMLASETSGYYKEQVDKLKDVLIKPITRHAGEVKGHEATQMTPKAARLTIMPLRKDVEVQATRLTQDVGRAARSEPGFVAFYGALTEDGKTAAISFWDSEENMKRSESRYLKEALTQAKELSTSEPRPKLYQVVQHEIPAVAQVR